jgi:hypothetical protein
LNGTEGPREMAKLVKVDKYYINPESITVVYPAFVNKAEGSEIHFVSGQPVTVSVDPTKLATLINQQ